MKPWRFSNYEDYETAWEERKHWNRWRDHLIKRAVAQLKYTCPADLDPIRRRYNDLAKCRRLAMGVLEDEYAVFCAIERMKRR